MVLVLQFSPSVPRNNQLYFIKAVPLKITALFRATINKKHYFRAVFICTKEATR